MFSFDGAEDDMRKRWRLLLALLVVLVLAGVALLLSLAPKRPEVSLTTLVRLDPGMTEAEVAALLGPPTDDVTGRVPASIPPAGPGGRLLMYSGERATATVEFGPDGRLVRYHPVLRTINLEERIRLRLNWW
jgi:hypothetical protein